MNTKLFKLLCVVATIFVVTTSSVVAISERKESVPIQETSRNSISTTQTNTSVVETTTELTTTKSTTTTQPITKSTSTTKATATKPTKSAKSYSQDDLYVLSHIIYAEAGNQSDECQLAVGSVVLNRVKSNNFPNTIYGVVFQKGQYSPTWNGAYYKEPSDRAIKNAKYLLENGSVIPVGVVYQAEFIQGPIYKQIGNTYFCYG